MNCFNKNSIFVKLIFQITIMYKKFSFILILAAALFAVSPAFSQKKFESFGNLSVGAKLSTLGYGFEVATPLNNLLMLRLGVNLLNLPNVGEFDIKKIPDSNGEFKESLGYIPDYRFKPNADFKHGNLLLDFHILKGFHLTAGAFVGKSILKMDGRLVNPANNQNSVLLPNKTTWPSIDAGDHKIDFTNGRANMDLQMGNTLKPYFGFGFGRAVPKKSRLSFKFEVGALYQKGYTLRQNEVVFDFKDSSDPELKRIHNDAIKYLAFWPMMNFQLSYRIF